MPTHWGWRRASVWIVLLGAVVQAQEPSPSSPADTEQAAALEPIDEVLTRAAVAHDRQQQAISDLITEGAVHVYDVNGADVSFGVKIFRNGERQAQHIFLRQADGKNWNGRADHLDPGGARVLNFIETQHIRGPANLLAYQSRQAVIVDQGSRDGARVVTVQEQTGRTTDYFIDESTSQITKLEYVSAPPQVTVSTSALPTETFVFSNFRLADGISTPFTVEHFTNGVKREELQLNTARYNIADGQGVSAGQ